MLDNLVSIRAEHRVTFNEEVEQCIALTKGRVETGCVPVPISTNERSLKNKPPNSSGPRDKSQVGKEIHTIARLPSVYLKHEEDGLGLSNVSETYELSERRFHMFSSNETYGVISDQGLDNLDLDDEDWTDLDKQGPLLSQASADASASLALGERNGNVYDSERMPDQGNCKKNGALELARTGSFASYMEVDEEKEPANLFRRIIGKVNTVKDIAYVIWACGRR